MILKNLENRHERIRREKQETDIGDLLSFMDRRK